MNEQQVREHVRKLRRFYTDALIYAVVNLGLIFIWLVSGAGYFWPIWVIVGWGIGLGVHAFSLGLIPQMTAMVPFMTADWEDQEVKRLMEAGYKGKGKKKGKKVSVGFEGDDDEEAEAEAEESPQTPIKRTTPAKKSSKVAKKPKL